MAGFALKWMTLPLSHLYQRTVLLPNPLPYGFSHLRQLFPPWSNKGTHGINLEDELSERLVKHLAPCLVCSAQGVFSKRRKELMSQENTQWVCQHERAQERVQFRVLQMPHGILQVLLPKFQREVGRAPSHQHLQQDRARTQARDSDDRKKSLC